MWYNVVVNKNSDSLITNVKKDNIVKNGNGEEILFEKGYYSLGMIIAMLNTMEYSEFQVTTSTYKFGCLHMNSSCPIDFSQAEDLRYILGLTKNIYSSGSHYGDNIIDFITRYKFGENSEQNDFDNKSKDLVREKLAKEVLPFLPWEMIDDVYKEARLEAKKELYNKNNSENMENQ